MVLGFNTEFGIFLWLSSISKIWSYRVCNSSVLSSISMCVHTEYWQLLCVIEYPSKTISSILDFVWAYRVCICYKLTEYLTYLSYRVCFLQNLVEYLISTQSYRVSTHYGCRVWKFFEVTEFLLETKLSSIWASNLSSISYNNKLTEFVFQVWLTEYVSHPWATEYGDIWGYRVWLTEYLGTWTYRVSSSWQVCRVWFFTGYRVWLHFRQGCHN